MTAQMSEPRSDAADPDDGPPAGLLADHIDVHRGRALILRDVRLAARPGEVHALVGPNGAGKSTLLSALAGDLRPTTGSVMLHGVPLHTRPAREIARLRAVVPQQTTVAFGFTAREIVGMGRAPWARSGQDDEAIVAESLATVGALALADRSFATLSGGERALVVMAKALAQRVGVLLLDEPTAALDIGHSEQILRLARLRAEQGDTVVAVLHDLSLAAAHADTVSLVAAGALVATGSPREVLTAAVLSRAYHHPIEVVDHPRTGQPLVVPIR